MRTLLTTPAGALVLVFVTAVAHVAILPLWVFRLSGPVLISPRRAQRRGDTRRDPDAVVRRPADRQPRLGRHRRADPFHARHVPDRVLRQAAAPALHVPVDGLAESVRCAERGPQIGQRRGRQIGVLALQIRGLAVPSRPRRAPPSCRTRPSHDHLTLENVEALMNRPSAGGTRKPLPAGSEASSNTKVASATEAYSIPASSAAATGADVLQQPRSRSAGHGHDDRVDLVRRRRGHRTRHQPPALGVRVSSLTIVSRRIVTPAPSQDSASAAGNRPTPPRIPANTGFGFGRAGLRGEDLRHRLVQRLARTRRREPAPEPRPAARSRSAWPGVDPAEQRLDQPVHDLAAERARPRRRRPRRRPSRPACAVPSGTAAPARPRPA